MIDRIKKILRSERNKFHARYLETSLAKRIKKSNHVTIDSFNFKNFKCQIICFLKSMQAGELYQYKYSASCSKPTLYASSYACMTFSLLGELSKLSSEEKNDWRLYFDSFQSHSDGLFYDKAIQNEVFNIADWWGARHLALHMIAAYTELGFKPRYPFLFLEKYYDHATIQKWLDQFNWNDASIGAEDLDNKIMNIGCLLQYQRDSWGDARAADSVVFLKQYLRSKLNVNSGMWGNFDHEDPHQCSRMVQFAYHLFPIFFYDGDYNFDCELIVNLVLKTRNKLNGFGVNLNSSACEDIDSIDLLIRLHEYCTPATRVKVGEVIRDAFAWVMLNQVEDGGFVFRLEENFEYGSPETSSIKNKGAMLPTWFRTLSVAYMSDYLTKARLFTITKCPGYEFK